MRHEVGIHAYQAFAQPGLRAPAQSVDGHTSRSFCGAPSGREASNSILPRKPITSATGPTPIEKRRIEG